MAQEFLLVTQFLTVAVMLGLAGWLLWLKFTSPVNRSFALVLGLTALRILFALFSGLAKTPERAMVWDVMAEYLYLVLPFVMLYFLVVYLRPHKEAAMRVGLVIGALIVVILYMRDHCLDECLVDDGLRQLGPLALISQGAPFVSGVIGTAIAAAILWGHRPAHANASALVAASFVLSAVFNSILSLSLLVSVDWNMLMADFVANSWQSLAYTVYSAALLPGAIGTGLLILVYRKRDETSTRGRVFLVALAISIASAVFVVFAGESISENWALFIAGLWLLLPPSFIAYALLRHRILGIDHQMKTAVRSSTIASFFAVAFFIGSELIENWLGLPDLVWGLLAAGAIALALKPIQMLANRLAENAFPDLRPVMELTRAEREDMFREQALLVWADGNITSKERSLLDRLQKRLDLPAKTAKSLEQDAKAAVHLSRKDVQA